MGLEVYWLEFAENKLEDIYSYYVVKAGEKVARKLIFEIVATTSRLEK